MRTIILESSMPAPSLRADAPAFIPSSTTAKKCKLQKDKEETSQNLSGCQQQAARTKSNHSQPREHYPTRRQYRRLRGQPKQPEKTCLQTNESFEEDESQVRKSLQQKQPQQDQKNVEVDRNHLRRQRAVHFERRLHRKNEAAQHQPASPYQSRSRRVNHHRLASNTQYNGDLRQNTTNGRSRHSNQPSKFSSAIQAKGKDDAAQWSNPLFPALVKPTTAATTVDSVPEPNKPSGTWLQAVGKSASLLSEKPTEPKENLVSLAYGSGLTVLRPKEKVILGSTAIEGNRQATLTSPKKNADNSLFRGQECSSNSTNRLDPLQIAPLVVNKRSDFSKLRDRWWDIMRNRPISPVNSEERDAGNDDASSSSGSSDLSFVDVVPVSSRNLTLSPASLGKGHPEQTTPNDFILESAYSESSEPLHEAIRRGNAAALRLLLKNHDNWLGAFYGSSNSLSPLELAAQLDRPTMLSILLKARTRDAGCLDIFRNENITQSIFTAAERGYEECLQVLLMESVVSTWTDSSSGNNLIHACCRGKAPISTLKLVLCMIMSSSSTSNNNLLLSKLFLAKNDAGQTPLHIVCEKGRDDLLDMILSTQSFSLLSKLLLSQDKKKQTPFLAAIASGATDVVMNLLMWRGNNNCHNCFTSGLGEANQASPCPLKWAVRSRNLEMVLLLLEFNDPAGKGYDLNEALRVAVRLPEGFNSNHCHASKSDLARVLIDAGASPCSPVTSSLTTSNDSSGILSLAVEQKDVACLITMLDSHQNYLARVQRARRRDPVLQKQPESFFSGIESREAAERTAAIRDALVTAMFSGYMASMSPASNHGDAFYDCCLALQNRGASLGTGGLERLKLSLNAKCLKPPSEAPVILGRTRVYETRYQLAVDAFSSFPQYSRMSLPWADLAHDESCMCGWILTQLSRPATRRCLDREPPADVVLISNEGSRFLAHSEVLSQKSDKLAAAIRFNSMTEGADNRNGVVEIKVDASSQLCGWMLEHIYHGSIVSQVPRNYVELSRALCELMLVAEEFICPSLIQECEMRLLSAEPWRHCFCRFCARQGRTETESGHCSYQVIGPSACIRADTVLDVLAVSQHLTDSLSDTDAYTLRVATDDTLASLITTKPLETLQAVSIEQILLNFYEVGESAAFLEVHGLSFDLEEATDGKKQLLHMCLAEYANSCLNKKVLPGSLTAKEPAKGKE